jgi:hypothetical protein
MAVASLTYGRDAFGNTRSAIRGILKAHVGYVHYNPVKHGLVKSVAGWPYSSFHRYVRLGWLRWIGRVQRYPSAISASHDSGFAAGFCPGFRPAACIQATVLHRRIRVRCARPARGAARIDIVAR